LTPGEELGVLSMLFQEGDRSLMLLGFRYSKTAGYIANSI
jgi:hypothetical protein